MNNLDLDMEKYIYISQPSFPFGPVYVSPYLIVCRCDYVRDILRTKDGERDAKP